MNYELIHSLRMYFTATPEMLEKRQLHAHPRNTRNRRPNTNAERGEREGGREREVTTRVSPATRDSPDATTAGPHP